MREKECRRARRRRRRRSSWPLSRAPPVTVSLGGRAGPTPYYDRARARARASRPRVRVHEEARSLSRAREDARLRTGTRRRVLASRRSDPSCVRRSRAYVTGKRPGVLYTNRFSQSLCAADETGRAIDERASRKVKLLVSPPSPVARAFCESVTVTTSEQARLPAEFKHIIKRRKRN